MTTSAFTKKLNAALALILLCSAAPAAAEDALVKTQTATFAGGCFWGFEKYFAEIEGVVSTRVGYAGGSVKNPTYEQVCTGLTGHAESLEIVFDPARLSYQELLKFFFTHHDPTTPNRQGNDVGPQYRSAIFTHSDSQLALAQKAKQALDASGVFKKPVTTEIKPAGTFYAAEDYHQKYLQKNPNGYCHINLQSKRVGEVLEMAFAEKDAAAPASKKLKLFVAATGRTEELDPVVKTDAEWRKLLTPEQYAVTRQKGTERPFSNQCSIPKSGKGVYQCVGCGTDLFKYENKFESGTGWPSFYTPVSTLNLRAVDDSSHGMERTEVICARCGAHLGHVFPDGPPPTGLRYCINAVALKLSETS